MVENIIPYIGGEEEKSEKEPLRLWGKIEDGKIVPASDPVITCQCIRVPVLDGHTAAVFVNFEKKPTKEQIIESGEASREFHRNLIFQVLQSSSSSILKKMTVHRLSLM